MEFIDLLDEFRIPHVSSGPKARRGWVNFQCPFCERNPYMGYNTSGGYVHCWNCGRHPLWETLHYLTKMPAKWCIDMIGELPRALSQRELPKTGVLKLPLGVNQLLPPHREYLRSRRFKPSEIVNRWDVKGIGIDGGMLKWRLFLPIYLKGEVVSWTTRALWKREPRYWSAKDEQSIISVENLLYGMDAVRQSIVVVEGPLDVWRIGYGAVALMGQRISPAQLEQISRVPVRVVCFDNEPEAQRRARKLANDLSVFDGATHNVVLDAKDPGEAGDGEIESLRKQFLSYEFAA